MNMRINFIWINIFAVVLATTIGEFASKKIPAHSCVKFNGLENNLHSYHVAGRGSLIDISIDGLRP